MTLTGYFWYGADGTRFVVTGPAVMSGYVNVTATTPTGKRLETCRPTALLIADIAAAK